MGVICSSTQFVVLKQTRQCAVQTWGLLCAGGSPKPEDAHPHVQLQELKTEPISVPACSHSPQTTRHLWMSPVSHRGTGCSHRLGWLQSPPAAVRSQPSSGQCWFPFSWAGSGVAVSSASLLFPGHPHRFLAVGCGMWRFGQQPEITEGGNWIKSRCWHRHRHAGGELLLDFHRQPAPWCLSPAEFQHCRWLATCGSHLPLPKLWGLPSLAAAFPAHPLGICIQYQNRVLAKQFNCY